MSESARHAVLLLETIDDEASALLKAHADVELSASPGEADCLAAAGERSFDAIMTRGKGRVTAALLDACPDLVCAARCGVGLDNVDIEAATARGVAVLNLPGCNAQTIAEHTIMLMLTVIRGGVDWANTVIAGQWQDRAGYDRDELHGRTVGVVGLGAIGSRVARIASALGTTVVYSDPVVESGEYERLSLDALLARADVTSLHCALTDETHRLLNADRIERMKPGAVLINTARGGLIDQDALADALQSGALGGFGADVLDVEPPAADEPLLHSPNVVITPHVGSLTRSTYKAICMRSVENVLGVLSGRGAAPGTHFNVREMS